MKMYLTTFFVLLVTALTVNSEKHSLKYIYTAFSKPVGLPGIHQFTAMGQLDGRMIDYYDSDIQRKVPKQDWMKERLPAYYWEKGTRSRQSKQQWFKDNIDILKKRMNQTEDDLHVLQWMVGCESETTEPEGIIKFVRGVYMYNYDGRNFLYFDDTNSVWVAATEIAVQTKRKWDHDQDLKEKTKDYLEYECIDWLDRFMLYGKKQLIIASPPDVHVFAKNTRIESNLMLSCLATGFYTKDIILIIRRNGRTVTRDDGLFSSGVRPNGDETFQRRDSVVILKSDISSFTCEFFHIASSVFIEKVWYHKVIDEGNNGGSNVWLIVVPLVVLLVAVAVVLVVLKARRKRGSIQSTGGDSDSDEESGSRTSTGGDSDDNGSNIIYQGVKEGKLAFLSCPHFVEGKVTWSREINGRKVDIIATDGDEEEILYDPQRKRYGSTVDKSLFISGAIVSDSGTYYCNNEPAAELTVIPSGTEILQTTERSSINLTCPHDDGGSHVPTWSREIGGKQKPIRLHVSTVTKTLMLPNLRLTDSGLYLCDGKPAVYLNVIKVYRQSTGRDDSNAAAVELPIPSSGEDSDDDSNEAADEAVPLRPISYSDAAAFEPPSSYPSNVAVRVPIYAAAFERPPYSAPSSCPWSRPYAPPSYPYTAAVDTVPLTPISLLRPPAEDDSNDEADDEVVPLRPPAEDDSNGSRSLLRRVRSHSY